MASHKPPPSGRVKSRRRLRGCLARRRDHLSLAEPQVARNAGRAEGASTQLESTRKGFGTDISLAISSPKGKHGSVYPTQHTRRRAGEHTLRLRGRAHAARAPHQPTKAHRALREGARAAAVSRHTLRKGSRMRRQTPVGRGDEGERDLLRPPLSDARHDWMLPLAPRLLAALRRRPKGAGPRCAIACLFSYSILIRAHHTSRPQSSRTT